MIVQFNTSSNVNGKETFTAPLVELITTELGRFTGHITRIEAHLTDEDGRKNGIADKRCVLEARIEGKKPIAAEARADTYQLAVESALDKLNASLNTIFGKVANHH